MNISYNLYTNERDLIGITPRGPVFGKLTITDERDQRVRPHPMQKCTVEFFDEHAIQHWSESRNTFWIRQSDDPLLLALAHLNGQSVFLP